MITTYKTPTKTKITSNIAHLSTRYNPTNTHTQLWTTKSSKQIIKIRFTPTFCSQIFCNQSNQQQSQHIKTDDKLNRTQMVRYENNSKLKRQIFLNSSQSLHNINEKGIKDFVDTQKYCRFKRLDTTSTSYCRNRKMLDLSSNPLRHEIYQDLINKKRIPQDTFLPNNTKF